MCRLILTAGVCLIIANFASSASLTDTVLTNQTESDKITKAPSATDNFCEGKADGNYANPSNPNSFYGCSNGLTNILFCPEDLVFKQSCNCCDWRTPRSDVARDFCKGKKNGNYFNPSNINSFYSCSNGLTYIMKCPEDLIFNQRLNACVWP